MGGPGSGPRRKRVFDLPEETFDTCPSGHDLPHEENGLECAPTRCALAMNPQVPASERLRDVEAGEVGRLAARERARRRLVPVPEGLTGADADEYVERKIVELGPRALAEQEYLLKHGSDAERDRASRFLLDAGGHGKKDRMGQAANMIVIHMGGGGSPPPLPWSDVVDAATKVLPKVSDA